MGGGRSQRRHNGAHSYRPFLLPPVAGSSTSASCSLPQGLRFTPRAAFSVEPRLQLALTPPRPFLESPHQKLSSREFSRGTFPVKHAVSNSGGELLIIRSCKPHSEAKKQKQKNTFPLGALLQAGATGALGETLEAMDPRHWQERTWEEPSMLYTGHP